MLLGSHTWVDYRSWLMPAERQVWPEVPTAAKGARASSARVRGMLVHGQRRRGLTPKPQVKELGVCPCICGSGAAR